MARPRYPGLFVSFCVQLTIVDRTRQDGKEGRTKGRNKYSLYPRVQTETVLTGLSPPLNPLDIWLLWPHRIMPSLESAGSYTTLSGTTAIETGTITHSSTGSASQSTTSTDYIYSYATSKIVKTAVAAGVIVLCLAAIVLFFKVISLKIKLGIY